MTDPTKTEAVSDLIHEAIAWEASSSTPLEHGELKHHTEALLRQIEDIISLGSACN